MNVKNVEKTLMATIKRMLKIPNITSNERLKISLAMPDLKVVLCERLKVLKAKYLKRFKEECNIFNKYIEEIEEENRGKSCVEELSEINLRKKVDALDIEEINPNLRKKLNKEIYKWYVHGDRYLLKLKSGKIRKSLPLM